MCDALAEYSSTFCSWLETLEETKIEGFYNLALNISPQPHVFVMHSKVGTLGRRFSYGEAIADLLGIGSLTFKVPSPSQASPSFPASWHL